MTPRDRTLATLRFGQPDRVPLAPGWGRQSTRARWQREGLPVDVADPAEYAYRLVGGQLPWPVSGEPFAVNFRLLPEFEEKVLSRGPRSQVVQDWKGNVCEIGNEFDVSYLRNAIDFVTRRWLKCPVAERADWPDMQRRYVASDPARLPADAAVRGARLADRAHYLTWSLSGPFWQLREWLGFEGLCYLLHDDPQFAAELIGFWQQFVLDLLGRALAHCVPDEVYVSEDMAYKSFAMISPAMVERLLVPVWAAWGQAVKAAGVPVYAIDSDGYVGELLPLWLAAGFNVCDPMEVAAGNDLVAYRAQYGHRLAFRGGIDKRLIAQGGAALSGELARLAPVVRDGGYLPGCDHGVPADVSWPAYTQYVRELAQLTGWL